MITALLRRRRRVIAGLVLAVVALSAASVFAFGGSSDVVVYNGRSQYGDEDAFTTFEAETGIGLELRGGTAPELFQRLRSEGDDTPADLLVTTDLVNLWRAKEAGLLQPVTTEVLRRQIPAAFRDPDGDFWGLSLRIRTPMRSTERVPASAVDGYEDLGAPRFRGRLCLRTSNNEYNQSLVADMLAKRGAAATRRVLESWMANDPLIVGSDVDVLESIAAGRCDVGLTNHYYLGRILAGDPDFPVAPAWPDQDGRGAHTNLSGVGLVRGSEHRADAIRLMEYLTGPEAQREIVENSELAANVDVAPAAHIRDWATVKKDPIDVARAGALLPEAIALMQQVGWR
ncbi:MAG TPA: extracellular solute-binding protein [Solirubrobacteraceae bacterium]|nr:extracellular solute-binding protein [Solirubrobacteraceae bacterium]